MYNEGTFTMNGGIITGNTATGDGGGVFNTGTFTLDGGDITSNTAQEHGGGVFNADSSDSDNRNAFTMASGTITGNEARAGGGMFNGEGAIGPRITLTGGDITDNTATEAGGGVANFFAMTAIEGYVNITDNKAGAEGSRIDSNLMVIGTRDSDNAFITYPVYLTGELAGSTIGVQVAEFEQDPVTYAVTYSVVDLIKEDNILLVADYTDASDSTNSYTVKDTDLAKITSDNSQGILKLGSGGIVITQTPPDDWTDEGNYDTSWYNTTDTTFTLTTAEQLAGLAAIVNGTATDFKIDSFANKTIKLGGNINLGGYNRLWVPIGTSYHSAFKGTFDGQGHTVSNMTIDIDKNFTLSNSEGEDFYVGFIGGAYNRRPIKNVHVTGDVSVSVTGTGELFVSIGGVVGMNNGSTESCSFVGDIHVTTDLSSRSDVHVGGALGYNNGPYSELNNCYHIGNITVEAGAGDHYVGGVLGENLNGAFSNSYHVGTVAATGSGDIHKGGVAGTSSTNDFANSYYDSTVDGATSYAIGMVDISLTEVTNVNTATVKGVPTEDLKQSADLLNAAQNYQVGDYMWATDSISSNSGYPILTRYITPAEKFAAAIDPNGSFTTVDPTTNTVTLTDDYTINTSNFTIPDEVTLATGEWTFDSGVENFTIESGGKLVVSEGGTFQINSTNSITGDEHIDVEVGGSYVVYLVMNNRTLEDVITDHPQATDYILANGNNNVPSGTAIITGGKNLIVKPDALLTVTAGETLTVAPGGIIYVEPNGNIDSSAGTIYMDSSDSAIGTILSQGTLENVQVTNPDSIYLITIDANGGTVDFSIISNSDSTEYLNITNVYQSLYSKLAPNVNFSLPTPTRTGYTFVGWSGAPTTITGDTDIIAEWKAISDSNSGSSDNDDNNDDDTSYPEVQSPSTSSGKTNVDIEADPTTVGGTSKVDIPDNTLEDAVENALDAVKGTDNAPKVTIEVDTPRGADSLEVELDSTELEDLAENEEATFEVKSDIGTMTFDNEALNAVTESANGADITIVIRKVNNTLELTEEQQEIVGNSPTYELYITVGGRRISDFGGGTVTVKVPETLALTSSSTVVVYYISADGSIKAVETVYDRVNGTVTFVTQHFSHYVIMLSDKLNPGMGSSL